MIPGSGELKKIGAELNERIQELDPVDGEVLGRLNDSVTGEIIPAKKTFSTLEELLSCTRACYGAFDPTVQILWDVYDFELGGRWVSDSELADALRFVDYKLVEIDRGGILRKAENVRVGLGPVLPGAIVDWSIEMLCESGMDRGFINCGQFIGFWGEGDKEFIYNFNYPLEIQEENQAQLTLGYIKLSRGEYLAALDDDEKYFFSRGQQFHMIIDPVNGRPVRSVRAAVVVSEISCLQAAIFAYAVMVMGEQRGLDFLTETEGVSGLILTQKHELKVAGDFENKFWR